MQGEKQNIPFGPAWPVLTNPDVRLLTPHLWPAVGDPPAALVAKVTSCMQQSFPVSSLYRIEQSFQVDECPPYLTSPHLT